MEKRQNTGITTDTSKRISSNTQSEGGFTPRNGGQKDRGSRTSYGGYFVTNHWGRERKKPGALRPWG